MFWRRRTARGSGAFFVAAKPSTTPPSAEDRADLGVNFEASATKPRRRRASSCASRASGCGISTAARCRRAGRAGCSSSSSSRSRSCSAGARRRQSVEQVRRDGLPVGRDSGERTAGRRRRRRRRRRCGGGGRGGAEHSRRVSAHQVGASRRRKTVPQLKKFLEDGGTILAIGGSAMNLARPDRPAGRQPRRERPTASERAAGARSSTCPARCCGWPSTTRRRSRTASRSRSTCSSTTVRCSAGAERGAKGVKPVAWFDSATPLRSGWAWGQHYLEGGVPVVEARSARASCSCSVRRSRSARSRTARGGEGGGGGRGEGGGGGRGGGGCGAAAVLTVRPAAFARLAALFAGRLVRRGARFDVA